MVLPAAVFPIMAFQVHQVVQHGGVDRVFWLWVAVPAVLAGLFLLACLSALAVLRMPVRVRAAGRALPWWAAGVADRGAALSVVVEAERCLHAADPLLPRALFVLRCARDAERTVAGPAAR